MKIFFDPNYGWRGGAWLDRLHETGYSVSADMDKEPPLYFVHVHGEHGGISAAVTSALTEDELQLYIKLLIGGDDG